MSSNQIIETASIYRKVNHKDSGVVLIWEGAVYGWKDKLRNANHERPGAIAVDTDGNLFQAQGGDEYNGANHWVAIDCNSIDQD